eukprot:TRINITY_DN68102_c0_g1_i1.p2 TRINITY_DN68102_c0_g1~~TRINITY_DN68102_c0_g1_i1.p2  ORF type:complete len:111 (-),score=10.47 TRINITY_DN68102_c0_g1_i1:36-368(-)
MVIGGVVVARGMGEVVTLVAVDGAELFLSQVLIGGAHVDTTSAVSPHAASAATPRDRQVCEWERDRVSLEASSSTPRVSRSSPSSNDGEPWQCRHGGEEEKGCYWSVHEN